MSSIQQLDEPMPFEVVMGYLPGADTSGPEITPTVTTVAFVLWPRAWWAGSDAAVVVPSGTDVMTFDIRLDSPEPDFTRFAVMVRDLVSHQIVWETKKVTVKVTADHASILAVINARALSPRHYTVDLTGCNANGQFELISRCPFELLAR